MGLRWALMMGSDLKGPRENENEVHLLYWVMMLASTFQLDHKKRPKSVTSEPIFHRSLMNNWAWRFHKVIMQLSRGAPTIIML